MAIHVNNKSSIAEHGQNIKTYKNYINGEWVTSVTRETYHSINPANTEEVLGYFQKSNQIDVQKAVESAKKAFPAWASTSPISRGDVLFQLIYLLE